MLIHTATSAARMISGVMIVAPFLLSTPDRAEGQSSATRFSIDPASSLAWWQLNPHLNHLWATTCPQDPSWQPGEDRSAGWTVKASRAPKNRYANVLETRIPLFPRDSVVPICPRDAVEGEVTAADTTSWRGVKGQIVIRANTFITGLKMRDEFASKAVLHSQKYPEIRFLIDSLTAVQLGDTVRANAVGVLQLHGTQTPMAVPIKVWRDGGALRVTGQFEMAAADLVEKYRMSRMALGLGVGTGIWKKLHIGVDVILKPAAPAQSGSQQ